MGWAEQAEEGREERHEEWMAGWRRVRTWWMAEPSCTRWLWPRPRSLPSLQTSAAPICEVGGFFFYMLVSPCASVVPRIDGARGSAGWDRIGLGWMDSRGCRPPSRRAWLLRKRWRCLVRHPWCFLAFLSLLLSSPFFLSFFMFCRRRRQQVDGEESRRDIHTTECLLFVFFPALDPAAMKSAACKDVKSRAPPPSPPRLPLAHVAAFIIIGTARADKLLMGNYHPK